MDEAIYLKKKIRSGNIDVHPTEQALVVHYDVEALILGELGDPMLGDRKECQRIIRLRSLNPSTDVKLLAKDVIDKCSLIHESKLHEVEQLIYYLQNRKNIDNENAGLSLMSRPMSSSSLHVDNLELEKAVISNIDSYMELLYEEIPDKIKGSSLILQLARVPDNLQELSKNESLLSVLARVLREDWKKSIDLSINIIYIFYCFSTYSEFHNFVMEHRIGSQCMDIIDYELSRYDQWREDLEKRRRYFENTTGLCLIPLSTDNLDKKVKFFDDIWSLEGPLEFQLKQRSTDDSSNLSKTEIDRLKEDLEKSRVKFKNMTRKQEQLLKVAFYLLLNIAESADIEKKMRKKNIVGMLIKTLNRSNTDLLILVITFLKKLSIYRENVDVMIEENVIEKLPKLLYNANPDLISCSLKLLFNLSFDPKLRGKMIKIGLLPIFIKLLLQDNANRCTILGLLYHCSYDDKVKAMFSNTECVSLVTDMLLKSDSENVSPELIALCVNLAINSRNAEIMVQNSRLQGLVEKAFKNQSAKIMKIVRNISQHECTRDNFIEFVGDFAMALTQSESQDFVLEIIGVMGNLVLPDLDYSQILERCNLIPWIHNNITPGKAQDDLVLEVVIFLGTAAADEDCAQVICEGNMLQSLIELLKAKQEDDEMVLQIIYVFYQVSKHETTRQYLISKTEAPGYLIDLMHDKNSAIRKVCDACLDVIALCDKEWAANIKLEKFRSHNKQWLDMVESINLDNMVNSLSIPAEDEEDDDGFAAFRTGELLEHTLLFPSDSTTRLPSDDDDDDDDYSDFGAKVASNSLENSTRPISRYSRDLDEICELMASSKSRLSMGSGIEDLYHSSKLKFDTDASHLVI